MNYVKKNGLVYSEDMRTIISIDSETHEFTGRVPFGAKYIEDEIFANSFFETISLPDSVEVLGACLFENSKRLFKVKLPSTIKELPPYLFSGCSALQVVSMPTVLKAFPEGLFNGCSSLLEIPFRAGIKELPENVFAGCSSIKSLVIPETVSKICSRAVADCTDLTTLVLPAALFDLADDAFEGCTSIRNIRISDSNNLFYVSDEDGCLYERTLDGDVCRLKIAEIQKQEVSFFKDNVDDENEPFFTDEGFDEEDDTFSSEVTATSEEIKDVGDGEIIFDDVFDDEEETEISDEISEVEKDEKEISCENQQIENGEIISENKGGIMMDNENQVDDMLADIMNDERARADVQEGVEVDEKESQILTDMMDVMNDKPSTEDGVKITEDELEKLFASHEQKEIDTFVKEDDSSDQIDAKTKTLIEAARFSKIIECEPAGEPLTEADLFVIAEITVQNENGEEDFTEKLINCCKKFAQTQDLKRIVILSDIPVENEEFMQFFKHFISYKNVVLACNAPSPSKMSPYAKTICDSARIDLSKEFLLEQRKKIGIKNNTLIKLVIQDLK